MSEDTTSALGWSLAVGACYGVVALAFVLVLDLANPTFAAPGDFVLSATGGVFGAGSVLWWRGAERPGILTRARSAAVGAVVGAISPTLAFALNPSVYGSSPNVLVDVVGGVVAACILGLQGLASTFGLPIALGALTGWSLAGWLGLRRD